MLIGINRSLRLRYVMLSLVLAVCLGCNSDWTESAATARVHGEITLDGIPLDQAKVVFVPVELRNQTGKLMPLAFGMTDAEGQFHLKYSDGGSELIAGNYSVIIAKQTKGENNVPRWETEWLPDDVSQFEAFNFTSDIVPSIYNRESILEYEVKASAEIIQAKFALSSVDPLLQEPNR